MKNKKIIKKRTPIKEEKKVMKMVIPLEQKAQAYMNEMQRLCDALEMKAFPVIVFPNNKISLLGRFALYLLKRCKAMTDIQFINIKK